MKSILVTGLCTLHWGRLQYGNVGNYYIMEPLFRQLHKTFKGYKILTTFQMDDKFAERENIEILPMDMYYKWDEDTDISNAYKDVQVAELYTQNVECETTPYIDTLKKCEYVINVSGDMWGDNAEHVGANRFFVDCLKMKAAQIMKKKTILYAVTPGPFSKKEEYELAKSVFEKFDLVVIREKVSRDNLLKWGISVENVIWAPCPSFLFEANRKYESAWTTEIKNAKAEGKCVIGMTFGGFNMPYGPYDMWPRDNGQYEVFENLVEYMVNELNAHVILFSHTNGFELPPKFQLINGRDYFILKQFYEILLQKNSEYSSYVTLINEPLLPCDIKAVIGQFDMLLTGRVHASVAGTSQNVPTVYMEYDRNVIYSDKMTGFSEQLSMEAYVCEPGDLIKLQSVVKQCYENLEQIRKDLEIRIPEIQRKAMEVFELIKQV